MGETLIAKDLTGNGLPVFSAAKDAEPWGFTKHARKRFRRGTIVIGARGTIGFPRLPDFDEFISTQTTIAVTPGPSAEPAFLAHALARIDYSEVSAHQAVPMLTIGSFRNVEVSLPPLEEQRRIAAVLSAIDARCLAGSEAARTATAFKNALLHHEFQVADRVPLDDINQADRPICYGILMPGQGHPGGVPVVKVKDIKGGEINTDSLLLTSPELDHQYRRSRLRGGDVLLTIRGTTGRVAVVPPQLDGANITQDTARISVVDPTLRDWIYYALQAPDVQQQIADNTRGQAVKGINIGDVRKLSIPMPPPTERSRVVAVLAATDRLIRSSLAEVATVRATRNAVAHRLLGGSA